MIASVVTSVRFNLQRVKNFYFFLYIFGKNIGIKKPAVMQVYSFCFLLCLDVFCMHEISLFHVQILKK